MSDQTELDDELLAEVAMPLPQASSNVSGEENLAEHLPKIRSPR
ncbi:MAG: hypothetical protein U5K73_08565 [Halofilum sp. (in: g-proteobacteria)]|nr:hypothetical protein [Halofilum sp. (in: g-proteobacteria)]